MNTGRRSAFVIYDETAYQEFREYLVKINQDASHYIWSLILQEVSRIRKSNETPDPNSKLTNFSQQSPPPRIIEDFEHVIRPYLNNSNEVELELIKNNGYKSYVFASFCLDSVKMNLLTFEQIRTQNISYDRALRGLENLRDYTKYHWQFAQDNKK